MKKRTLGELIEINDDEYILFQGDGTCRGCDVTKRPIYCDTSTCLENKLILKNKKEAMKMIVNEALEKILPTLAQCKELFNAGFKIKDAVFARLDMGGVVFSSELNDNDTAYPAPTLKEIMALMPSCITSRDDNFYLTVNKSTRTEYAFFEDYNIEELNSFDIVEAFLKIKKERDGGRIVTLDKREVWI